MPKSTFLNLPPEKRRRIIELATDEFAANTYHSASLSRIVERAGIAKGSIYQYFEGKLDLYVYVLKTAAEVKLAAIAEEMARLGPAPGVFDMLRAAVRGGFELARRNPKLTAIATNFVRERDPEVVGAVTGELVPAGEAVLDEWFAAAARRGELAPGISPPAARLAYFALGNAVNEELASGRLTLDEAGKLWSEMIDILEFGLRPRAGTAAAGGPGPGDRRERS